MSVFTMIYTFTTNTLVQQAIIILFVTTIYTVKIMCIVTEQRKMLVLHLAHRNVLTQSILRQFTQDKRSFSLCEKERFSCVKCPRGNIVVRCILHLNMYMNNYNE